MADAGAHLERLRWAEAAGVRRWLPTGARVLELGGADGFQARLLANWGCQVVSVDLPNRPRRGLARYPVLDYDGWRLPCASGRFDRVYSSNVLEHVLALPALLAETRRVLRPGGLAVHLVPSAAWRLWTSLAHYAYLARYALAARGIPGAAVPDAGALARRRGVGYLLRRALLAGPHGAYPSALAELYYFSAQRWRRLFECQGFTVEVAGTNGLFYTGYGLAPGLSLAARGRLARWLGAACHVFVLRPATPASAVPPQRRAHAP
jgi:SAM-dependent methyltransferase